MIPRKRSFMFRQVRDIVDVDIIKLVVSLEKVLFKIYIISGIILYSWVGDRASFPTGKLKK